MEPRPDGPAECTRAGGHAIGAVGSLLLVGGLAFVVPWVAAVLLGIGAVATGPISGVIGFMTARALIQSPAFLATGITASVVGSVLLTGAAWLARDPSLP